MQPYTLIDYVRLKNSGLALKDVQSDGPKYYNRLYRELNMDTKFYKKLDAECKDLVSKEHENLDLYKSFFYELQNQRALPRYYNFQYGTLHFDEKSYCEIMGITTYSKKIFYLYDLSQSIDIVLAILLGYSVNRMRKKINKVLAKYNIDYVEFSRSWLTGECLLQEKIPAKIICEIDSQIANMAIQSTSITSIDFTEDVMRDAKMRFDMQIRAGVMPRLLSIVDFILTGITTLFDTSVINDSDTTFVTKGMSSVLISSNLLLDRVYGEDSINFYIDTATLGILKVVPTVFQKGRYIDHIFDIPKHEMQV